ncbi:DUF2332 domain-containing protein [Microbacterium oleivorans]|uniref:DUF2332 domain-containing protein n=1 Tax=Microbacterium oleivorans TaxID=273677 RepID=A0A7D5EU74_9MICO|nr:DUF2332 domain-containing protein [Microbacterium oleivorans]QLD10852.1 DUF2332 domain-containing protein [Microbacterium oleivorans]
MPDEISAIVERYRRFAVVEAPGRSDLYAAWASRVAEDPAVQRVLVRLPGMRRQPPLVFAVSRLLGSGDVDAEAWSAWLLENADAVVAECLARSVQTNEPLRCAALLPALSLVDGPIALLEIGASAGLCLYPDRYSYVFTSRDDEVRLDPDDGPSPVVLHCSVRGERMPRVRMPEVVWRAGIDLNPLDVRESRDVDWLAGLVWPGEVGRAERIRAAAGIAAADPPLLRSGDALALLAEVAVQAPADATLVVSTPGVLAHIPRAIRGEVIAAARAAGRWLTIDDPALHDGWRGGIPIGWADGFAVALDGEITAAADPLGRWWEWRPGSETNAP